MKPLLRAVLLVDALLLAGFGALLLLSPWKSLYDALQLATVEPAMVGQAFGVALLGLAWLSLHAAVNGDLTAGVARAVGHVNWLTGVVMLVWLIGLRTPSLSAFGQIVSVGAAAVLLVVGLGGVRLAGAVRRRERAAGPAAKGADAPRPAAEPEAPRLITAPGRTEPTAVPVAAAAGFGPASTEGGEPRSDAPRPPVQP
jgi:hypothetical protein